MYRVFNNPFSAGVSDGQRHPPQATMNDAVCSGIITQLEWLLTGDNWRGVAETAKSYVLSCHTWQHRATELRQIINEELGL